MGQILGQIFGQVLGQVLGQIFGQVFLGRNIQSVYSSTGTEKIQCTVLPGQRNTELQYCFLFNITAAGGGRSGVANFLT